MAALAVGTAVGVSAGIAAERAGKVEEALAALTELLGPAVSSARALVAGGLPGLSAVEGAAVVAASKVAAPAAAAAEAVQRSGGSRKGAYVVALLALGAGVAVNRVGVKGVKRAWRQARGRAAPPRRAAARNGRSLTSPGSATAGAGRRAGASRRAGGRGTRRRRGAAAGRGQRQADWCVRWRRSGPAPPNRNCL